MARVSLECYLRDFFFIYLFQENFLSEFFVKGVSGEEGRGLKVPPKGVCVFDCIS